MKNSNISSTLICVFLLVFCSTSKVYLQDKISDRTTEQFKIKGFHLDLRIQVMTPKALKSFAKELAGFGINTLVLEWEATYPYIKHTTISNEYSYTRAQVKSFIDYCEKLGIDVIPLQQCFGHVEYILIHDRYDNLREDWKEVSQVCPLKIADNKALFTDLFTDMAAMHNSEYIHIGGDETYLLGHCNECSAKAEKVGKSKLFIDYMKIMSDIVITLGKKPIMWADIVLKHPEAADELSKEIIFIDWNYGWKTNHFGDVGNLQQKGFTFWGSPALRSGPDNWYTTDWEKHFNNQRDFIPYAKKAGYKGLVMTSWSTSGLYGFTRDRGNKILEMEQIRNVYPLSGFRILVAAYAESLQSKKVLNPEKFVVNYAMERFGFNKVEGEKLWKSLSISQEILVGGKPKKSENIAKLISNATEAQELLYSLKTKRNIKEFEHFKLMIDIRLYYLTFSELESVYNSSDFTIDKSATLITKLKGLFIESKKIDKRFINLNEGFLYNAELEDQNRIRNLPFQKLYNRLIKLKK